MSLGNLSTASQLIKDHSIALTLSLAVLLSVLVFGMGWFSKPTYQPKGKHCYITGGTQGLGKALAESLVKQGAHVTVVARDVKKGERVEAELKALASPGQKVRFISADLIDSHAAEQALIQASEPFGGVAPDYVLMCAGFSRPKFFVEASSHELRDGFDGNYWVSAWTAHTAAKMMVKQRRTGKIVFVSSFLGYASFAGYSTYSPGKYALRGLADALRNEMILHNIDIHIFMPCGILGPGHDAECAEKPALTAKIEEGDTPIQPEECARYLESGLRKGHYQITDNLVCDFVRLRSNAGVPTNNVLLDTFYLLVSTIGVPIWRMTADASVKKFKKSVEADLEAKRFYDAPATTNYK
ncbi:3-ketodihydrosphingosine reductase TSC10 [Kwoniella heveanensis CBS 569]|nr:3-ketodihydrosphingosine reductase TSC10 [Kwoniella heveanensis CBS 569]